MSRKITDLPDKIDPVKIIKNKLMRCPICGGKPIQDSIYNSGHEYYDAKGKKHLIRYKLNKYKWEQYYGLVCENCGCEWNTGWYPVDHKMFQINVDADGNIIYDSVNKMLNDLNIDR